jgi:hypothetical protein
MGTTMLFWKFVARPVTSPNNASIEDSFWMSSLFGGGK